MFSQAFACLCNQFEADREADSTREEVLKRRGCMLKVVEFGLLAVSLLAIFGLILMSPGSQTATRTAEVPMPDSEAAHAHAPLGAKKP